MATAYHKKILLRTRPPGDTRAGAICSLCLGWYPDFEWLTYMHDCPGTKRTLDQELDALRRLGVAPY